MESKKLKGGLFLTTKDLQNLNDSGLRRAQLELRTLANILEVDRNKVTVSAYCEYYGLNYTEVISHINSFR
jgi:hypothetical protein